MSDYKLICNKCGKEFGEEDKDKEKSTKSWTAIKPCKCGGNFWPRFDNDEPEVEE